MYSDGSASRSTQSLLLALPDPCLLEVLQYCAAEDKRTLFNAARAHSRLQQAAVAALNSITAVNCNQQQVLDSVLLYLGKHGRHLDSVQLKVRGPQWGAVDLRQLPPNLRLSSLHLESFSLQLQPGKIFRGVLGVAADLAGLKQLHLCGGTLVDDKLSDSERR